MKNILNLINNKSKLFMLLVTVMLLGSWLSINSIAQSAPQSPVQTINVQEETLALPTVKSWAIEHYNAAAIDQIAVDGKEVGHFLGQDQEGKELHHYLVLNGEESHLYISETVPDYEVLSTWLASVIAPQADSCDTSTNRCNCVFYARCKVPKLPYGLNTYQQKYNITNSSTPSVGAVAVHNINGSIGHVSVVTAVSGGNVTITEANYKSCQVGTRTGTPSALKITRYFKP